MMRGAHHTRPSRQDYRTPRYIFEALSADFGPFAADLAASPHNALVPRFLTDIHNEPWPTADEGPGFVNPPFAKVGPLLELADRRRRDGCSSVWLLPASTDTAWFYGASSVCYWELFAGRFDFLAPDGGAIVNADGKRTGVGFGCAVLVFDRGPAGFGGWRSPRDGRRLPSAGAEPRGLVP